MKGVELRIFNIRARVIFDLLPKIADLIKSGEREKGQILLPFFSSRNFEDFFFLLFLLEELDNCRISAQQRA